MNQVLNIVLLSLVGLLLLAALYFMSKALGARSSAHRQAYNVGQVEANRTSQVYWVRAAFCLIVGLIFLGIFAIRPLFSGLGAATSEPTLTVPAVEIAPTLPVATEPAVLVTMEPTPTGPSLGLVLSVKSSTLASTRSVYEPVAVRPAARFGSAFTRT